MTSERGPRLLVRECGITAARVGVARLHRHLSSPPPGGLFALEVVGEDGWPVGWAIVGRASSRVLDGRGWVEVTRCSTDGTRNACSILYGAASRWARARHAGIVTYTREDEPGASLRGAGWVVTGESRARRNGWGNRGGRRAQEAIGKMRWCPPWFADLMRSQTSVLP